MIEQPTPEPLFTITQLPGGQLSFRTCLPPPELNLLLDQIKLQIVNPPKQGQIVVPPPGMKVG